MQQVLGASDMLFTMEDILEYCEIWQRKYAHNILTILSDVFDDIDIEEDITCSEEEEIVCHVAEWDEIRNDYSTLTFIDFSEMEGNNEDSLEQSCALITIKPKGKAKVAR